MSGNLSLPRRNRPPRGRSSAFPSRCRSCRRSRPERPRCSQSRSRFRRRTREASTRAAASISFFVSLPVPPQSQYFIRPSNCPSRSHRRRGSHGSCRSRRPRPRRNRARPPSTRSVSYFVQLFNNQSVQSAREKNNSSVITDISRTEPAEFFAQIFFGFFQKPLAISIGMCYNNSVNHESLSCAQLRAAI